MTMRLYAAIVGEETDVPETKALNGLGKATKQIERLETMVADAWQTITTQRQADPPLFYQAVFLAPEYFFSNQRHMQHRFFSHDVKRTIISRLHALARKYEHLLIIPGTVLWTKDLFDTTGIRWGTNQPIKALNTQRQKKAVARITTASGTYGTETNVAGWSHTRDIQTADRKLAQNVAYICLGDKILKYHKVGNYEEVKGEVDDLLFVPGSIVGRFNVGGVKYGIEVCMDHAQGVFHTSVPTEGTVHVQIIVSSHVSAKENTDASVTLHPCTQAPVTYGKTDNTGKAKTTKVMTPRGEEDMPLSDSTGTNPIRFSGDRVGKLVRTPIKKGSYTLWVIDLDAPDIQNPSNHTLSSANLNEVSHYHPELL
jgi:hypothetical protein